MLAVLSLRCFIITVYHKAVVVSIVDRAEKKRIFFKKIFEKVLQFRKKYDILLLVREWTTEYPVGGTVTWKGG